MGKVLGVQQFLSAKKRRMEFTGPLRHMDHLGAER